MRRARGSGQEQGDGKRRGVRPKKLQSGSICTRSKGGRGGALSRRSYCSPSLPLDSPAALSAGPAAAVPVATACRKCSNTLKVWYVNQPEKRPVN